MRPAENKPDRETLRSLYEEQRLTTRQIGKEYGVAHITIRRWLTGYGITVRPKSQGLAHRGVAAPTAEELHDLVHVQHLSYVAIAARYDVHFTAVPQWLDRHGVKKPDPWVTRRKGHVPKVPTAPELRHRRASGESATSIAKSCGVGRETIVALCRANGIQIDRDGWKGGRRYPCRDGHQARSLYEQRVDDWLTEHGLAHEVEPHYPFDARYQADFINHWQLTKGRKWWLPLEKLLRNDTAAKLF